MKKNLLISGLGGSLFPYLHHHLAEKFNIFYLDNDSRLKFLYPDFNFFSAPLVVEPAYFDLVKNVAQENKIDFYIPLIDEEMVKAKQLEGVESIKVIAPTPEFSTLCLDKAALMQALNNSSISIIQSITGDQSVKNFPVFLKPIVGRGSRGIRRINNQKELDAYYILEGYQRKDILVQELIEGTEYTVGVTISNLNDVLEISVKRIIRKKGITLIAITERNELIRECVFKVVNQLSPCGPINIQLYVTKTEEIKIFEINPRFSTTTIMSYAAGIDVISLYIETYNRPFKGEAIEPKSGLTLHRRWENVFYES